MSEQREKELDFIWAVIECAWDGEDVPGDCLQDWAVKAGILVPTEVTEACGENCRCAEWDDFPQACYRLAEPYKVRLREDPKPA